MKLGKKAEDFLKGKHFAKLATLNKSGSPELTPVWYTLDQGKLVINTARGRQKFPNMKRDDRVVLLIDEGYQYISVVGRAREATEGGANKNFEAFAIRFNGGERGRAQARKQFWKEPRVSFEIMRKRLTDGF